VPVENSVRERRRAETVREIKSAALVQLTESGTGGLSLRAVARAVGMTVQSLYHYFDSRDALLTELVTDAHGALADAAQAGADATRGLPARERRRAATAAYRRWAHDNRASFMLLYGTPVPGFEPLPDAGSSEAALRLATPFLDVVFDGWTPQQLAAVPIPEGGEPIASIDHTDIPLPAGALAYFLELRARMHGLVILELLGHLHPFDHLGEPLFVGAMRRMSDEIDALQSTL
jgi:AcrR family transcriptional regulator